MALNGNTMAPRQLYYDSELLPNATSFGYLKDTFKNTTQLSSPKHCCIIKHEILFKQVYR